VFGSHADACAVEVRVLDDDVQARQRLARCVGCAGGDALDAAGVAGDLLALQIRLQITPDGSAKVSEALETLLGRSEVAGRIVRAALSYRIGEHTGSPLDLDTLRALRSSALVADPLAAAATAPALVTEA
jgi:hypothetical protein